MFHYQYITADTTNTHYQYTTHCYHKHSLLVYQALLPQTLIISIPRAVTTNTAEVIPLEKYFSFNEK